MDGLSAAASVIAVIEISAIIASLCFQYSVTVKNAKEDARRLQKKADNIGHTLKELKQQLVRPDGTRLSATCKLTEALRETQLNPGKTRKAMTRLGGRAMKWPFKSKEIRKTIASVETYKQTFSLSLRIDQT